MNRIVSHTKIKKQVNIRSGSIDALVAKLRAYAYDPAYSEAKFYINGYPIASWFMLVEDIIASICLDYYNVFHPSQFSRPLYRVVNSAEEHLVLGDKVFSALSFKHDYLFDKSLDKAQDVYDELFDMWDNNLQSEDYQMLTDVFEEKDIDEYIETFKQIGLERGIKEVVDAYYVGVPIDDLVNHRKLIPNSLF